MQQNDLSIYYLFPDFFEVEHLKKIPTSYPFSDEAVIFLDALSKFLINNQKARAYPDVISFAFFCRKNNILKIKKLYFNDDDIYFARGIIFHIAPSNVAINFAYSLLLGFVTGNINIVKVPTKNFEQIDIICNAIQELKNNPVYKKCVRRIYLIRYDRFNDYVTELFSSICDVRVIWGGNETIKQIRKKPLPAQSFDISFADRYSFCILKAEKINTQAINKLISNFYNDTYLSDQAACTSPHLVLWLGTEENVMKAQSIFWENLDDLVKKKYVLELESSSSIVINKLTTFYQQSTILDLRKINTDNNLLWRVNVNKLTQHISDIHCSHGYFLESRISCLSEIIPIINRKYQTLTYYGFEKEELKQFIKLNILLGIDRIVPVGRAMDFSMIWDSFDLPKILTKTIEIT